MAVFYVDGKYLTDSEAALSLTDMAILRGYAVFDFLRTYGGKPFYLYEHLQRLQNSAALLRIPFPWTIAAVTDIVNETLQVNGFMESNIRLLVSGGDSLDSITPLGKPRLIVMVSPVSAYPESWYREGVKVITTAVTRYIPGAKSTNYIKAILALKGAGETGAIESIYVNGNGQLLEGTTSNIFVVREGALITPVENILHGLTRRVVMTLAAENFNLQLGCIHREDIKNCTEAFLTSSTKEIVPVIQIDDHVIGNRPGRVTGQLMEMFHRFTQTYGKSK